MRYIKTISMIALLFSFSVAEDLPLGSSIPMADIKMKDIFIHE